MSHRRHPGIEYSHPSVSHRWIRRSIATLLIGLLCGIVGCSAPKMKDELIRTGPSFALAPADQGVATAGEISQNLGQEMFAFLRQAQEELLHTNAYIIPSGNSIGLLQSLADRGVKVRILTNSLASHDVPAVNSHCKEWRDDIINTGAELYELRADPAIKSIVDVPPVVSESTGLHTEAVVVDRKRVFVGSMNFDPRSFNINTEMGAFVDSAERNRSTPV